MSRRAVRDCIRLQRRILPGCGLGTVASLGLVSPGAANQGVTQFFSWNNWPPLLVINFSHFYSVTPIYFHLKNWRPFFARHSGVTHPRQYHPHLLLPDRPRFSTVLCKFTHKKIFFRVSPHGGCHPGRPAPPSDATNSVFGLRIRITAKIWRELPCPRKI